MKKPITFLLVDDDMDDVSLFEEVVKEIEPSLYFRSAFNGRDALQKLEENDPLPDLVFLDLNMPVMDGKQCLTEMKSDEKLKHIPVLIYTTSSQSKDIEEAIQKGAICFITKPAQVKELKNILSTIVHSMPYNLKNALQQLSNNAHIFIVC